MSKLKKNMLLQGGILAAASLITKLIGFFYRIPMGNMLGEEGNGLYSVAFGIYGIALTISSFSLPLAVSKLTAARLAGKEYRNVRRVVIDSFIYAFAAGLIVMSILYFGADTIEVLYNMPGLARPLRILAPTTFIVAVLGVFRGYFQGYEDMVPTSISQVLEQIVNAIISVLATWQYMKLYKASAEQSSYGAAGGTMGTLAGAAAATLYISVLFFISRARYKHEASADEHIESHRYIVKMLLLTIVPIILSQTIFQIGYTIDDLLFGQLMAVRGYTHKVVTSLQGVFNTQYNQLVNLPVSIATAMASSILPSITASRIQNDIQGVHQKITQVIKVNMVVAFPSAVGLAVLAEPIMQILFPSLVTYRPQAVMLLTTSSSAVVFYVLSALAASILQGNNYMKLPVIHSAVSLGIHVVLLGILLLFTDLNVYALGICNIIFPIVVSVLNCRAISEKVGYQWEYKNTFLKPLTASVLMGFVAYDVYYGLRLLSVPIYAAFAASVTASVIIYAVSILYLRCFSREELAAVPGLKKLAHFYR